VRAERAHHLAAYPLDADQLVDGPERVLLSVSEDALRLGRTDAGEEAQDLGRGGVEVDGAGDGFSGGREFRNTGDKDGDEDEDGYGAEDRTHGGLSPLRWSRCLVI
jgi:hypothetical protein